MKITIVCVGKIKEKFYRDAVEEYKKRLGRYCKMQIVEVADEKTPDKASEALENQIKEKEGKRILEQIKLQFDAEGIEIPFNQLDVHIENMSSQNQ